MIQKIVKTGNSLAITIPSRYVKKVGLKAGDRVESQIKAEGNKIVYTFLDTRQLSLSDKLFREIKETTDKQDQ